MTTYAADLIQIGNETRQARDWARLYGMPWSVVSNRCNRHGYSFQRAITEPVNTKSDAGRKGRAASPWNGQPFLRGSRRRNPT